MEKKEKYLYVKKNWCERCGICIEFCPKKIIKMGEDGYPEINELDKCVECKLCVVLCPDFAIIRDPEKKEMLKER